MKLFTDLLSVTIAVAFIGGSLLFAKDMSVAYRTPKSLSKSFRESSEAEKYMQTLTKLGCKVNRQQDGRAFVVHYDCPKWRSVSVSTEKNAHEWEKWLRDSGFKTLHGHGENHEGEHGHRAHAEKDNHDHGKGHAHGKDVEELQYRLSRQVTLHPEKEQQYQELIAILKGLGCTIDIDSHDGHTDILVQCRSWKHVELPSHQTAQVWEKWLKDFGFEIKHSHDHH